MEESNYSIKITPKASDDLDDIYSYISRELFNQNAADNLFDRIELSIMRLKDFPFSCNFVADEYLQKKGYRKLIIDNYVALYLVDEAKKEVVVMRVLYSRRKYEDLI